MPDFVDSTLDVSAIIGTHAVWIRGADGNIVGANKSAALWYGVQDGPANYVSVALIRHAYAERDAQEKRGIVEFREQLVTNAGPAISVRVQKIPLMNNGSTGGVMTVAALDDGADGRRSIAARHFYRTSEQPCAILTQSFEIESANEAMCRLLGADKADLINKNLLEILERGEQNGGKLRMFETAAQRLGAWSGVERFCIHPDKTLALEIKIEPISAEGQRLGYMLQAKPFKSAAEQAWDWQNIRPSSSAIETAGRCLAQARRLRRTPTLLAMLLPEKASVDLGLRGALIGALDLAAQEGMRRSDPIFMYGTHHVFVISWDLSPQGAESLYSRLIAIAAQKLEEPLRPYMEKIKHFCTEVNTQSQPAQLLEEAMAVLGNLAA